jgi:single-strand DNA-binding protein
VETDSSNGTSINVAIVRGVCSSPPEVRVLPSEQRLAQLQITTRVDGRALSVPVSVIDPPAWLDQLDTGDELIVIGAVRRRFFRAAGSTASRVEIDAEVVCRARDRRRSRRLAKRVAEVLEGLE